MNLTSFDKMNVTLALPNEAPRLLAMLVTSKFYATATLTQRNSAGAVNNVWVLGTVNVSDSQFLGSGDGSTEQHLSFVFLSMSHATSTDTVAWNAATQLANGPALPTAQWCHSLAQLVLCYSIYTQHPTSLLFAFP